MKRSSLTFNPPLATELPHLNSADYIIDALAFWTKRLRLIACPDCAVVGTLRSRETRAGLLLDCERTDIDRCEFEHEIAFYGEAAS